MCWPGPQQVKIIFGHTVIGAKPHEDQKDTQYTGEEEKQAVKYTEEGLCIFILCVTKQHNKDCQ